MEYILLILLVISVFLIGKTVYRKTKHEEVILLADENCMEKEEPVTLGKEETITLEKEEIAEERIKQFTGIWDSKRLLLEILRTTESVTGWGINLRKKEIFILNDNNDIYCKRIISVINAFKGDKVISTNRNTILLHSLLSKSCSDDKIAQLSSLIMEFSPELDIEKTEGTFNPKKDFFNRMQLFDLFFQHRYETYKLLADLNYTSDTVIGKINTDIKKQIYKKKEIENASILLDKLLLLLLGDEFDKTITERELLTNYEYPNITDAELLYERGVIFSNFQDTI